nr:phosphoribosylformylglycinamidine synthase subunit PurQ [Pseudobdellovibrionaceae bacterium]
HFEIQSVDMVILPGGFSYGDYLRTGALAARTPVMNSVRSLAKYGKGVLGICNGFQILTESGLLEGALLRNRDLNFIDRWVELNKVNNTSFFAKPTPSIINLPVAHGEGRFFAPENTLKKLWDNQQVWWTYEEDINGSLDSIAGVMNETKNVAALMPHPERALFEWMGGKDGLEFLL